jgi:DNA-binding XRE family transcriptional regulator
MAKYRAIPKGYMTVGEVAKKMGITVRTLQYYDKEKLLCPSNPSLQLAMDIADVFQTTVEELFLFEDSQKE